MSMNNRVSECNNQKESYLVSAVCRTGHVNIDDELMSTSFGSASYDRSSRSYSVSEYSGSSSVYSDSSTLYSSSGSSSSGSQSYSSSLNASLKSSSSEQTKASARKTKYEAVNTGYGDSHESNTMVTLNRMTNTHPAMTLLFPVTDAESYPLMSLSTLASDEICSLFPKNKDANVLIQADRYVSQNDSSVVCFLVHVVCEGLSDAEVIAVKNIVIQNALYGQKMKGYDHVCYKPDTASGAVEIPDELKLTKDFCQKFRRTYCVGFSQLVTQSSHRPPFAKKFSIKATSRDVTNLVQPIMISHVEVPQTQAAVELPLATPTPTGNDNNGVVRRVQCNYKSMAEMLRNNAQASAVPAPAPAPGIINRPVVAGTTTTFTTVTASSTPAGSLMEVAPKRPVVTVSQNAMELTAVTRTLLNSLKADLKR